MTIARLFKAAVLALVAAGATVPALAEGFTTGAVPADGVYNFTFGVDSAENGGFAVPSTAVYDAQGVYASDTFTFGFMGTTETSYLDDVPTGAVKPVAFAIDGFQVVKGQRIVLHDGTDANGKTCVYGPAKSEYLPEGASEYEGRYPVRFSMRAEERAYYAVTCTVANASATANADVTLFSERTHMHAHHMVLKPGETRTFAWSVELAPNVFKSYGTYYDNAVNVAVVGENAALASLTVVKQPTTTENATVRGVQQDSINVGRTIWLCDDSTGTDQRNGTPFFSLQNYAGVGSALSRWAPANISIRNQGEGGLATNDNAHRNSCLLKPGDYLYVQYGHNEGGTESYAANLETYLNDANAAGACLLIVSPVERHSLWNDETQTYGRSLQGYAEAGEKWVEEKIAAGAKNVAFIDLNKDFNDWQNEEIARINAINPNISKKAAIEFYYQSSRGGSIDISHPNNAGVDRAAYIVWQNALKRVAAGEAEDATESQKIQAAVLKGITEGVQLTLGIDSDEANTPWSVTDEIIAAGAAPNSFWDPSVRAGYDFCKDVAVAAVDAKVNDDGTVSISGASMRVLNPQNYCKAVYDIVSADGATTNRYWSYSNYDASGTGSGGIVVPEKAGFLAADKSQLEVSAADLETLTIPAGGKAFLSFAVADGTTWQTLDNEPCSAIYPIEAWTDVLVDDDCTDATTWGHSGNAVYTWEVPDGADCISFYTTVKRSDGYWGSCSFYREFDGEISSGRYRVSFKTKCASGRLPFMMSSSTGLSGVELFNVTPSAVTVFGSSAAQITMSADETPAPQNLLNDDMWVDVDMIVDIAVGKAQVSVGGSEYQTYTVPGYADEDNLAGVPHKYIGLPLAQYNTHDASIDDLRIVRLAPSPSHVVKAAVTGGSGVSPLGMVTINGKVLAEREIVEGKDVAIKAISADAGLYAFDHWEDDAGETISTSDTIVIESLDADYSCTAVFREYGRDEDRVATWDFAGFAGANAVTATGAATVEYDGLSVVLANGDSLSADGLRWASNPSNKGYDTSLGGRYIEFAPATDGTVTIVFQAGALDSGKRVYPYLMATTQETMSGNTGEYKQAISAVATDTTLTFAVKAGTKYLIYPFYYYRTTWFEIKSIAYTCQPVWYAAEAKAESPGSATVSANETLAGKEVTFTATPATAAYKFVNWTDADGATVSTAATYTTALSADLSLTANFAAREKGEEFTNRVNFEPFDTTADAAQTIEAGSFVYHLGKGDSLTSDGVKWLTNDTKAYANTVTTRYVSFTAPASGTVKVVFQAGAIGDSNGSPVYPVMMVTSKDPITGNNAEAQQKIAAVATDTEFSFEVAAGTTYAIYPLYYNRNTWFSISSIEYPDAADPVTLTLEAGDGGSVLCAGILAGEILAQKGEYVQLTAVPDAYYGLASWSVSASGETPLPPATETYWHLAEADTTIAATFASESTIEIMRAADFAPFAGNDAITGDEAWTQLVGRMEVHGAAGDTLTDQGIYWAGPGTTQSDSTKNTSGRYIKFECQTNGKLTLTFSSSGKNNSNYGRIYVTDGTDDGIDCMSKSNGDKNGGQITASGQNKATTATFDVVAGKTYYVWPYMYSQATATFTVTALSWPTVKSDYSALTVEGLGDTASVTNLYYGETVAIDAPEIKGATIFNGWQNAEGEALWDAPHYKLTVTGETTVRAVYREANAHLFVWNRAKTAGAWNDPANWLYEGVVPAATYPCDASQDAASVASEAAIALAADSAAATAYFAADATLSGGTLTAGTIDGPGAITLSNAGFANPNNINGTINNAIVMTAGTTNWFNTVASSDDKGCLYIKGNISGEGCYKVVLASVQRSNAYFSGNNNDFHGDIYTSGGKSNRSIINWGNENAIGTNAYLHIGHSYGNYNSDAYRMGASAKAGGYDGPWWDRYDNNTLTIGYLNRDSTVRIENPVSGRANSIVKVGTANLTLTSTKIRNLTVKEGSVTMPVGIAPGVLTVADGAQLRFAAQDGWEAGNTYELCTWTTLDSAGELARQVVITGLADTLEATIAVEDNTVKATIAARQTGPVTDDGNATIEKNEDGSYTVAVEAETVEITIPEGVEVSEVVVSANTVSVTGVPESATVKVSVAWDGGSEKYAIVKIADGKVALDPDASIVVQGETIPVTPAFAEAGDEVQPLEVASDEVSVGVKTIPGLVYRLKRGTKLGEIDAPVKEAKATGTRLSLSDDNPPAGSAFYTIDATLR